MSQSIACRLSYGLFEDLWDTARPLFAHPEPLPSFWIEIEDDRQEFRREWAEFRKYHPSKLHRRSWTPEEKAKREARRIAANQDRKREQQNAQRRVIYRLKHPRPVIREEVRLILPPLYVGSTAELEKALKENPEQFPASYHRPGYGQ